jgi:hypothetical protein
MLALRSFLVLLAAGSLTMSPGCGGGPAEGVYACRGPVDCPSEVSFCRADMRCWSTPDPGVDAAMGLDAYVSPATDAYVAPGTDAFVNPGTDAYSAPGTDAFVAPGTDAHVASGTDAWTPDPDAYVLPPPDAYVPPATDAGPLPDTGGPCGGGPLLTFYRDADGDGHGATASGTAMRCGPGGGYVASDDDCDDANGARYPGNPEVCNGVDDNCDTTVDGAAASAACALPNATAICSGGFCEVASCSSAAFGNCDTLDSNGCEVDLRSSATHCSACGAPCGAAASCSASVCETGVTRVFGGGTFGSSRGQGFCALRPSGRLACWGQPYDAFHYLPAEDFVLPSPVRDGPRTVSLGNYGGCAITTDGQVWCFGGNAGGWFGNGSSTPSGWPVGTGRFGTVSDATHVVRGAAHTCVLRASGRVVCAGDNSLGQLGDGTTTPSATPVPLGLTGVTAIDAAANRTCVVAAGVVHCWGATARTLVGDGRTSSTTPVAVAGISDAVNVAVADEEYACALRTGGGISCWGPAFGYNPGGVWATAAFSSMPVELEAGRTHLCGRLTSGLVECWAGDFPGDGTIGAAVLPNVAPRRASGISGATSVAVTEGSSVCVRRDTGAVLCWGGGLYDGDATDGGIRAVPAVVSAL